MSVQHGSLKTDPPVQPLPKGMGATGPTTPPVRARTALTQGAMIQQLQAELAEYRAKEAADLQAYRARCDQADQRILTLSETNATLSTTNRHYVSELRANKLALLLAATLTVMGSVVVSYTASESTKFAALIVTSVGAVWGLIQGVMLYVKDDRDAVAARRLAIILGIIAVTLLCVHWHDLVDCFQFVLSSHGWHTISPTSAHSTRQ